MFDFRQIDGRSRFLFLRHAQSAGNVAKIAQGRSDFSLTDLGRRQAAQAGRWLADQNIGIVLSSPLTRASETAEIVAAKLNVGPVTVWPELNEVDIGPFSGLGWAEAQVRYPALFRRFKKHSWDGVPGAESSAVLYERAMALWQRLVELDRTTEQNILSVTHSGIILWIIKATLGNRTWQPFFPMPNCGVFRLDVDNRWVPAGEDQPAGSPSYHTVWSLIGHSPLEESI